jgi:hypothetical protein
MEKWRYLRATYRTRIPPRVTGNLEVMLPQHGGFTVLRGYPEVGLGGRCGVRERCLRFDLSKSRSLDKVSLKTVHARIWCENCDLSPETTDAAYYLPESKTLSDKLHLARNCREVSTSSCGVTDVVPWKGLRNAVKRRWFCRGKLFR